jgi:hypothetical protein
MRKLLEQLEEMHIRIAETSTAEETLVRALGEALSRLDQQLLADVQAIASEHEERRSAILNELQGLASSVGMFQMPRPAPAQIEGEAPQYALAGDWREATRKIGDGVDAPVEAPGAPRALFPHEKYPQDRLRVLPTLAERRRRASGG